MNLPQLCRDARTWLAEEQRRRAEEERQEMERLREELEKEKDLRRGQRRKRAVPLPDRSDEPDECLLDAGDDPLPPVGLAFFYFFLPTKETSLLYSITFYLVT